MKKTDQRNAVLGRLAASETVSLQHEDIRDNLSLAYQDGIDSIEVLVKQFNLEWDEARKLRDKMIRHLQASDLTMNINASQFFSGILQGDYQNAYQRNNNTPGYMSTRNQAEEQIFKYSTRSNGPQEVIERRRLFGDYNNKPRFVPSMRPRYGALNYTRYKYGAVSSGNYGRSFFVLKEHIKHNCTYTAADSFIYAGNPQGHNKVGTYIDMERIIINMTTRMRTDLHKMVNAPKSSLPPNFYVEAQIHSEIWFNRDIRQINIDNQEIQNNQTMRAIIEQFARQYRIELKFI